MGVDCCLFVKYKFVLFKQSAEEIRQLTAPEWPVVVDIESPIVEPRIVYAFFLEYAVHLASAPKQIFFPAALTHAEHYLAASVLVHPRVVRRHILQEVLRRVGIHQVVDITIEAIAGMIETAQCQHTVEDVGAAEEEVGSMKTAH